MFRIRITLIIAAALVAGCSSIMRSATADLSDSIELGILRQNDPELVRDGAPSYLLLIDGLLAKDPESDGLTQAAARLYGAYAGAFVDKPARSQAMSSKALQYAKNALCLRSDDLCTAMAGDPEAFREAVATADPALLDVLYTLGSTWAGYIQTNSGDWNAIAQIPEVEAIIQRVIALDAQYDSGWPQLYLGVLATLLPESYGGKPEQGREYFQESFVISQNRNLMALTLQAKQYARLVFDQDHHDALLEQVLQAETMAGDFTLSNALAQEQARSLLAESNEYF